MKLQRNYLSIISGIAPMGAVGLSLLLGSTLSGNAAQRVVDPQRSAAEQTVVRAAGHHSRGGFHSGRFWPYRQRWRPEHAIGLGQPVVQWRLETCSAMETTLGQLAEFLAALEQFLAQLVGHLGKPG